MASAYASLVSLKNNLLLVYKHPHHCFSFDKDQLGSLWVSVCFMINFMRSFNDSYGAIKEAAEAFESRIARAAQAAEDVIESHVVDQIHRGSTTGGDMVHFLMQTAIKNMDFKLANLAHLIERGLALDENIGSYLGDLREQLFQSKFIDRIPRGSIYGRDTRSRFLLDLQKAIEDMNYLKRKAVNLQKLQSGFKAEQPAFLSTPLASENNRMVGFDDQLHQLLHLLTGVPSSKQVISIVGMGGTGKTTLATNAFQNTLITEQFDVCLWTIVSQEFNICKILAELLSYLPSQIKEENSLLKTPADVSRFGDLGIELHKSLFGRKYLIVLDDMWSVKPWDKLKSFFPDTSNGSRIIVTTRQSYVANQLENWRFNMRLLDEDNSWDLFCQKTFEEQGCPPELEDIGKMIVGKCKGLPLAIVVMGGHLQKSSRTTEYWKNVANDMSSVLNCTENEECMNILSLSYKYLPIHLKPCFLFLGIFRKDREILFSELLNLWIGEGFIDYYKNHTLEQVALSYLMDLFGRNLISLHRSRWGDRYMIACRVHDLLIELCLKIAKKDGFLSTLDAQRAINRERRVVMEGKIPEKNHQSEIFDASTPLVRSLICDGGRLRFDLKLLRVLDKVDTAVVKEIDFQQVNLRYLTINVDFKSYLPSSISLLWNLQILIITGGFDSIIAPYEIWDMLQLRHVEANQLCLVDPLPLRSLDEENYLLMERLQILPVMENLHTLSIVENFRLSEEVCRRIPNIKELQVSYRGEPSLDYCPNNLGYFEKLESLHCYFDSNAKWHDFASNLTFPNSLTRLRLSGCHLDWEEVTVKLGSLPHLEFLEFYNDAVTGSEWTPVEGGFPCLINLVIANCDLIYWNADKFHFPVLKSVYFNGLSKLDEFPSGIGEIPTLVKIVLINCSVPSIFSAMTMVVEQEELGNEGIQLRVTFMGDEEALESFKQKVEEEDLRSDNIHLNLENS